jgi:hypothetical protein
MLKSKWQKAVTDRNVSKVDEESSTGKLQIL